MIIVLADSKGGISTEIVKGRDADIAYQTLGQSNPTARAMSLVHWEKGFSTKADAYDRDSALRKELGVAPRATSAEGAPHLH
jgi:hypothetical protein